MNYEPEEVKKKLNSILSDMSEHHWLYSANPNHDFKRQHLSKINFEDTVRLILTMQKWTVSDELINYFDMNEEAIPSQSTFNRRRGQITPYAFRYLFDEFAASFPQITHKTKGYCVLAADGTHVVYSTNEEIIEDYNESHMADHKGYNHMQMNAFLDVCLPGEGRVRAEPDNGIKGTGFLAGLCSARNKNAS